MVKFVGFYEEPNPVRLVISGSAGSTTGDLVDLKGRFAVAEDGSIWRQGVWLKGGTLMAWVKIKTPGDPAVMLLTPTNGNALVDQDGNVVATSVSIHPVKDPEPPRLPALETLEPWPSRPR